MTDFLVQLSHYPIMEVMFILSVILVLVDYFFPVDLPAYLGYLCFAIGVFFAAPWQWVGSAILALVVFVLLLILHRTWFTRYLTNARDRKAA